MAGQLLRNQIWASVFGASDAVFIDVFYRRNGVFFNKRAEGGPATCMDLIEVLQKHRVVAVLTSAGA
jgi:hypothetical protein